MAGEQRQVGAGPTAANRMNLLMSATGNDTKLEKKLAKAAAKAAKKRAKAAVRTGESAAPTDEIPSGSPDRSPAERAADAAERQVSLQRWRVVLALIAALIGLGTLAAMLLRG
jgi:hypothetical protein